jgi:hypothetical protein
MHWKDGHLLQMLQLSCECNLRNYSLTIFFPKRSISYLTAAQPPQNHNLSLPPSDHSVVRTSYELSGWLAGWLSVCVQELNPPAPQLQAHSSFEHPTPIYIASN